MLNPTSAFSSFSVDNQKAAQEFYGQTLGLELESEPMGLNLYLPGGQVVFVYENADHEPAIFTILNLVVPDIDQTVEGLGKRGVNFERYDTIPQDEKGVARGLRNNMGPDIAWFKDPAGNIISVLQASK